MDQSLEGGGSLDPDLTQSPNQSITVSAQGGQQAPNGNTSLSALQLSQDLVVLGSVLFGSGHTLNWPNYHRGVVVASLYLLGEHNECPESENHQRTESEPPQHPGSR